MDTTSTLTSASSDDREVRPKQGTGKQDNRRIVRAIVLGPIKESATVRKDIGEVSVNKADLGLSESHAMPQDDQLERLTATGRIVEPPFDLLVLTMLIEHSTVLQPCVEAMEVNCDGYGHYFEPRVDVAKAPNEKTKGAVAQEKADLENFFNYCCVDDSFTALRRKTRRDRELTGNAYWEVIRNPVTNEIQGFNYIPSYQMRLGILDEDHTPFERKMAALQADGSVKIVTETVNKRFRRFVQIRLASMYGRLAGGLTASYRMRWFKEYRDPRPIDCETGDVLTGEQLKNFTPEQKQKKLASEIIHWKLPAARTPYGLPRFIGNLVTIFGDRASDEINYVTLKNNNIPSMVVTVSNGQLTEATIGRIQEFVQTQIQGSENYSRFLIIEAESDTEGGGLEAQPNTHISVQPLTQNQHKDQLFQEYSKNNGLKIRASFRLPPIFVGAADDYNRGTADTSRRLADEQVFKPERDEFDNAVNKLILAEKGIVYHKFVSQGPNITDDAAITALLMAAERTGGMSPDIARNLMAQILGKDMPKIDPAKLDPDVPFSIQLAEKAKNEAFMKTGSPEVGSQVTALKSVEALREVIKQQGGHIAPDVLLAALLLHREDTDEQLVSALTGVN